jgi:hypothetical protein
VVYVIHLLWARICQDRPMNSECDVLSSLEDNPIGHGFLPGIACVAQLCRAVI